MNHKLYRTTGRIVRRELRALVDNGVIRDARVRMDRVGSCCRCRISSHTIDGSPIFVEAVGATRARAVRIAVLRLQDRVRSKLEEPKLGKGNIDEYNTNHCAQIGRLPRRRIGRRFCEVEGGWAIRP